MLRKRLENPVKLVGISTCFIDLDRYHTNGFKKGNLIVVATGHGQIIVGHEHR